MRSLSLSLPGVLIDFFFVVFSPALVDVVVAQAKKKKSYNYIVTRILNLETVGVGGCENKAKKK